MASMRCSVANHSRYRDIEPFRPNRSMKPTAPLRNKLTHSLPLTRPSAFPSMSHGLIRLQPESLTLSGRPIHVARVPAAPFPRAPFSVFAAAPSTSSRFPATLVRLKLVRCPHSLAPTLVVLPSMSLRPSLHSRGSRTPAILFFNDSRGLWYFLPSKTPFGLPVHVAPLDSPFPGRLALSGLPIHVARIPAAPFPRAPFSFSLGP
jgi:hypothetical protein